MKKIAIVDCNNFYASCERLFRPDLENKPIAVLSNQDGCIVARSNEVKKLGIKMGVPVFQVMHLIKQHNIQLFSSNYENYGVISERVMQILESFVPDTERYSIDEMFMELTHCKFIDSISDYSVMIKKQVMKQVGIPVSIGIAKTKTLAKLANHYAKQHPETGGVFDATDSTIQEELLKLMPLEEIWGVGHRLYKSLTNMGMKTAYDLACMPPTLIRQRYSVVLERTVRELNGESCIDLENEAPAKQQIICSRSFSQRLYKLEHLREAISTYTARAAEKLRAQGSSAHNITVSIRTSPFADVPQYRNSALVQLPHPTSDTRLLVEMATQGLHHIFRSGHAYAKAGVMLSEICEQQVIQQDLFTPMLDTPKSKRLMQVVDDINRRYPKGLFLASNGINPSWKLVRRHLSPHFFTNWDELPKVSLY
ncbi:Y-family DNA polymerase [Spartinivicinus ruber]|uniref:Y-family DNA polymerase n=1 Tax=Spartinivicinus ruber TaxID=2683272 RepID=UPI0013D847B9|nr:Y-family DNA polymerase [Spartinivicinus ruber]